MDVIALVVGELTAYLTVNNDNAKRGIRETKGDLDGLARDAKVSADGVGSSTERMVKSVGDGVTRLTRDAQGKLRNSRGQFASDAEKIAAGIGVEMGKGGDRSGGLFAQGMRSGLMRNSPLIVAGVGAALAAGAPLMMAGATGLFAGIGIVAAAQSEKVQSAWLGTWHSIRDGAISDAGVIEPVLVRVAANVGSAFERMRPQIRDAFSAAAPQIEVFSAGIVNLAQNAMPGLVRAVQAGMPVTQGLADFLAKVGSGLGEFFDRISAHGPAAGQVFSQLGTTMNTLLPLLGELLGQGAELATQVLPLLNGSLGLLLKVVTALGPALPVLVAGFSAMKLVGTVGGWVDNLGASLSRLGTKDIPVVSTAAGKMGGALSSVGTAAAAGGPLVAGLAVTFGLLMAAHQASEQRIRTWTAALNEGGQAARTARDEMAAQDAQVREATTGFMGFASSLTLAAGPLAEMSQETDAARAASAAYLAGLTPLQAAQRASGIAQEELSRVLGDSSSTTEEVTAASQRYKDAQAQVERQSGLVEQAIHGVTEAMIAQADQAMAAIDSSFGYRNAQNQLEDAQVALTEAIRDHGAGSEEAQRKQLALEEQTYRTAMAFGQQQADLSGLEKGSAEYNRFVQESMLASLTELQKSAGPEMQAAIGQQIAALQNGGVAISQNTSLVNTLTSQVSGLTGQIHAVPGQKYVQIDAPTAAQVAQIQALGYTVRTLPNGQVVVYADTGPAERAIQYLTRTRYANIVVNQQQGRTYYGQLSAYADGGPIRAAIGRKVIGPGGPRDDLVRAIGPGGSDYRLSAGEWITNAMVSQQQGDRKMAALNAGLADIVMRDRPVRGFAGGGSLTNPVTGTGAMTSVAPVVNVNISGTFDLASSRDLRRAAQVIEGELVKLQTARS